MQLPRFTAALLLSAAALLPLSALAQSQPASNRVLRVAPHADLKTLDPVAASIVSVLAFDFCFVPPRFSFSVSDAGYLVTFAETPLFTPERIIEIRDLGAQVAAGKAVF